jgi:chromosomal replication initiation ATPase DnaA
VTTPRQLPLDWPHEASFAREDFLPAVENAEALARVEAWPSWPSQTLLIVGPKGAGKSHLGAIWARRAGAARVHGYELADADVPELGAASAVLIDDADGVGAAEAPFFHLLNLWRERNAWVLMTAAEPPDLWGLATADLTSRLRLAPVARLGAPDVELMRAVLTKLFADRQIDVDSSVTAYLAVHLERSLDAARRIVAELDHEALARGKPVTRALAAEMLRDSKHF